MKQLNDGIFKKYREFYGREITESMMLEKFVARKLDIPVRLHTSQTSLVIGSIWEFTWDVMPQRALLRFCVDCGFGERNSLGFGFMNIL